MIRIWLVVGRVSPESWNRFAYVEGDPVNKLDSRGLEQCPAGSGTCVDITAEFINIETQWNLLNMSLQATSSAYAAFYGDSSVSSFEGLSGDDLAEAWQKRSTLQLRSAALEALKSLQGDCSKILMGSAQKISMIVQAANVTTFTYSSGTGASMSLSYAIGGPNDGPSISEEFARLNSAAPPGQRLWGQYWGASRQLIVVNSDLTDPAEVAATLVHELLHVAYASHTTGDQGHAEIFKGLGINAPANGASPEWIKNGCK